jgi:hypothetical protein
MWSVSTNESDFDMYNEEEFLNTPPKMDYDTISNLQSPTLQWWDSLLPTRWSYQMWGRHVHSLPKTDCICNQIRSRAWLHNPQHVVMGRNWYATTVLDNPASDTCDTNCFAFYSLFCKGGEWQDPHSLTYVCTCSVLVSSLPFTSYLKSHQCELPKQDTSLMHSSHNFTL